MNLTVNPPTGEFTGHQPQGTVVVNLDVHKPSLNIGREVDHDLPPNIRQKPPASSLIDARFFNAAPLGTLPTCGAGDLAPGHVTMPVRRGELEGGWGCELNEP